MGRPVDARPYSFVELEPILARRLEPIMVGRQDRDRQGELQHVSTERIAEILKITGRQVWRWRRRGLTFWEADRAAIRLGYMPYEVWPAWLDELMFDLLIEEVAA